MSKDVKKFVKVMCLLIAIGTAYAIFVTLTGIGIPCFFRIITGLQCPGCGISRMCLATIRFDFESAFHANPFLFCTFPFIIFEIFMAVKYGVKSPKWNSILEIVYLVGLILFAVIRNI